jgi:hypothetical protein
LGFNSKTTKDESKMEINVAEDILKTGMQRAENVETTSDDNKPSSAINDDEEHQRTSNDVQDSRFSSFSSISSILEALNWLMFFLEAIGCFLATGKFDAPVFLLLVPLFVDHFIVQFFISFFMGVYSNLVEIREILKERKNRPDERG